MKMAVLHLLIVYAFTFIITKERPTLLPQGLLAYGRIYKHNVTQCTVTKEKPTLTAWYTATRPVGIKQKIQVTMDHIM